MLTILCFGRFMCVCYAGWILYGGFMLDLVYDQLRWAFSLACAMIVLFAGSCLLVGFKFKLFELGLVYAEQADLCLYGDSFALSVLLVCVRLGLCCVCCAVFELWWVEDEYMVLILVLLGLHWACCFLFVVRGMHGTSVCLVGLCMVLYWWVLYGRFMLRAAHVCC